MVVGCGFRPGDGPGLIPLLGASCLFTTVGGLTVVRAGAGCRGRVTCDLCTPLRLLAGWDAQVSACLSPLVVAQELAGSPLVPVKFTCLATESLPATSEMSTLPIRRS